MPGAAKVAPQTLTWPAKPSAPGYFSTLSDMI
jgi:hypothetical protein